MFGIMLRIPLEIISNFSNIVFSFMFDDDSDTMMEGNDIIAMQNELKT